MKKGCELCTKPARMYCDSDQARLCWECDERVHCANFLVAKHFRSLLCHVCQSPTPWKASGAKLGPTVSVCDTCSTTSYANNNNNNKGTTAAQSSRRHHTEDEGTTESFVGEDSDDSDEEYCSDDSEDDDDYGSEEDDTDGEDEEEDGENQVVPWSPSDIPSSSAPPLTSSYCSEQESLSTRDGSEAVSSSALKRFRHHSRLDSDDEDVCCSSQINSKITAAEEENGASSYRAMELKMSRREECSNRATAGETESRRKFRRIEIMRSLLTFHQRMACRDHNASAAEIIKGISKLSRDI